MHVLPFKRLPECFTKWLNCVTLIPEVYDHLSFSISSSILHNICEIKSHCGFGLPCVYIIKIDIQFFCRVLIGLLVFLLNITVIYISRFKSLSGHTINNCFLPFNDFWFHFLHDFVCSTKVLVLMKPFMLFFFLSCIFNDI